MKKYFFLALVTSGCVSTHQVRSPNSASLDVCGVIQSVDKTFTQVNILTDPNDPKSMQEIFPSDKVARESKKVLGQEEYLFCQRKNEGRLEWKVKPIGNRRKYIEANTPRLVTTCEVSKMVVDVVHAKEEYKTQVHFLAAKNEYRVNFRSKEFLATRSETDNAISFQGAENFRFELAISKNQKVSDLPYLIDLNKKPENFDFFASSSGIECKNDCDIQNLDVSGISLIQMDHPKIRQQPALLRCEMIEPVEESDTSW